MKYVALLLVLFSLPVAASAEPASREVAYAMTDGATMGSAFKAGGVYRTAAHVVRNASINAIGWPGESSPAMLTCRDDGTDSASMESGARLVDWQVGDSPKVGDAVTVMGYLGSKMMLKHAGIVTERLNFVIYMDDDGAVRAVGPVFLVSWPGGVARGISGGPVILGDKAVAMNFGYNRDSLFVVPLTAQKCPVNNQRQ